MPRIGVDVAWNLSEASCTAVLSRLRWEFAANCVHTPRPNHPIVDGGDRADSPGVTDFRHLFAMVQAISTLHPMHRTSRHTATLE